MSDGTCPEVQALGDLKKPPEAARGKPKLLDLEGVAGLMLANLKLQKVMARAYRLRRIAKDNHPPAPVRFLIPVRDHALQSLHLGHPWRGLVVDEHGNVEVALREGAGNVRQMHADLVSCRRVFRIVGGNGDNTAIRLQ